MDFSRGAETKFSDNMEKMDDMDRYDRQTDDRQERYDRQTDDGQSQNRGLDLSQSVLDRLSQRIIRYCHPFVSPARVDYDRSYLLLQACRPQRQL